MTALTDRLETALQDGVDRLTTEGCPPRLAKAIEYGVFPAVHRFRPRLCLAVAEALGSADSPLALASAVAIEFVHGASLIQDDLPAFDNADERRGHPALHRVFGEALAVLAADALIIGAFDEIGRVAEAEPLRAGRLITEVARGVGSPGGAVAGQGWESEDDIDLGQYHRAKTAALFEAATGAGAIAAGHDPAPWRTVGLWLGKAYQIADDISDASDVEGAGSDAALGRPNAMHSYGAVGSLRALELAMQAALDAIPAGPGHAEFRRFLSELLRQFRSAALDHAAESTQPARCKRVFEATG
jgi:geranylgeranyl diphosphate synthase type II